MPVKLTEHLPDIDQATRDTLFGSITSWTSWPSPSADPRVTASLPGGGELKTYSSNMIKERIRIAQTMHHNLGAFYCSVGEQVTSLKHYTCLSVLKLLMEQRS
ncbi:hypothetical protein V8D89_004243 [Ganoderma adspersum]